MNCLLVADPNKLYWATLGFQNKAMLRDTWNYLCSQPGVIPTYVLELASKPVGLVALPAVLALILEAVRNGHAFAKWRYLLWLLFGCFVVSYAAYMSSTHVNAWVRTDLQASLRGRIVRAMVGARAYQYRDVQTGEILSQALRLPAALYSVLVEWRERTFPALLIAVAVAGYLTSVHPKLGLLFALPLLATLATMVLSVPVVGNAVVAADYSGDAVNDRMGDILDNVQHVYLSGAVDQEMTALHSAFLGHSRKSARALRRANLFVTLQISVMAATVMATGICAWVLQKRGLFPFAKFLAVIFVLMASRAAIYQAIASWPEHLYNLSLVRKLGHELQQAEARRDELEALKRPVDPTVVAALQGRLRFDDLWFRPEGVEYSLPCPAADAGEDAVAGSPATGGPAAADATDAPAPPLPGSGWVFRGLTLDVPSGAWVHVHGAIGSGKSSLASLAMGLVQTQRGRVYLDGLDVTTVPRATMASLIAYVPQNPRLLDRTVYENLALGTRHGRAAVAAALKELEVDFADLDTRVGKNGHRLSTGQRVTLYLARVVLRDCPLVICDEVTANLDAATEVRVLAALQRVARGRTLLFISHSQRPALPFTHALTVGGGTAFIVRQPR